MPVESLKSRPAMTDEQELKLKELIYSVIHLIELLENSCTQFGGISEMDSHEHQLFDDVDQRYIEKLKGKLHDLADNPRPSEGGEE